MTKYSLNSFDNEILDSLVDNIKYTPNENSNLFIFNASVLSWKLPYDIKYNLQNFKYTSKEGFLLLENVSIDENTPETPPSNNYFVGEKTKYAKKVAILNQYLGNMISYEGEGYGRLFQDMVPNKLLSNSQTSLGSKVELEIHTEQAFSKLRPDILTLACLKGDENAVTYILPVSIILEKMSTYKIQLLKKPLWKIGVDLSFKMNSIEFIDGDIRGPISILYGDDNDPFLVFDQDLMTGINEEAEQLKNEIIDIYYKYRHSYILKPGDILFVDNNRAVHGRSSFTPKYDGTDRFIIRSFITFNLYKSKYARTTNNKRMIEAKYS